MKNTFQQAISFLVKLYASVSASEIIIIVFLFNTFHKNIAEYSGGNFELEKKFYFRMRKETESFETYFIVALY